MTVVMPPIAMPVMMMVMVAYFNRRLRYRSWTQLNQKHEC